MAGQLDGKVALVTGARRGIGRGIALEMAREGADVSLNDVGGGAQIEAVAEEVRQLGRRAAIVPGDVSRGSDVSSFVSSAARELGRIDILVNNAGVESILRLLEIHEQEWERGPQRTLTGAW